MTKNDLDDLRAEGFRLPENGTTWVAYGDSITHGALHLGLQRSWFEIMHERIRWQCWRPDDICINAGVSGWTAAQGLEGLQHRVLRFEPDAVIIAFGTNDARDGLEGLGRFEQSLEAMVTACQQQGAEVVLQTPVPTSISGRDSRPELPRYVDVVRELAAAHSTQMVDHYGHWTNVWQEADPIEWMNDHIHPNAAGHLAMANLLLEQIGLGAYEHQTVAPKR